MTAREFHVADLVTVTSGHLLSPRGIGAVYELVDFVTGQQHLTQQLGRATEQTVGPELLRQHPWLADVELPEITGDTRAEAEAQVVTWAASAADRWGEMHLVVPLPEGAYVGREPIAELREMVGPDNPIITFGEPGPDDLSRGPR